MYRLGWPVVVAIVFGVLNGIEVGHTQPSERAMPQPNSRNGPGLWTVIASRRSARTYGHRELAETELAQLLWAGQGVVDGHRTTPSAGALYPLTIHVVDARGVWRYGAKEQRLVREAATDRRADVADAALRQTAVRSAAVTFVISGDLGLVAKKYGAHSTRFVTLEAGHAAQNMLLAATALELAAVPIGAFDDQELRRAIGLANNLTPLYLVAVGAPP